MSPRRKRILAILAALVGLLCVGALALYLGRYEILRLQMGLPPYTHRAGDITAQMVPARDGVRLMTKVYEPAGDGPWPVIVIRNPYSVDFLETWCGIFARFGYASVYQQARGRMESEGEWAPIVNEREDGLDLLDWIVQQSWCDGNIGMYGPSYLGLVQWAVADALPPEVKTLVPMVSGTDLHRMAYERGMFRHEIATAWAALMPGDEMRFDAGEEYRAALTHRPHIDADLAYFGRRLPWYREWVSSPALADPLWQRNNFQDLLAAPEHVDVPVLMFGGWFDIFFAAQLPAYQRLGSRDQSVFVVGPWNHLQQAAGELEYPGDRNTGDQWALVLDWFGHHLRGEPLQHEVGVIETYAIGANGWRRRDAWPPETETRQWHLAGTGDAARCNGGRLTAAAPEQVEEVAYRYDPDHPVPSRGGAGTLAFILPGYSDNPAGPMGQAGLCDRPDVLSFVTEPLSEALHIAGAGHVVLTVTSDAPDTAFTAKLIEVFPDGRAVNVRDSIASLAFRNGSDAPESYTPGTPVQVTIDFWPIEWRVQPGSRLRLDVSSSNFPMYHAHTNHAGPWAEQTDAVVATQHLLTGGPHTAVLQLPICTTCAANPAA